MSKIKHFNNKKAKPEKEILDEAIKDLEETYNKFFKPKETPKTYPCGISDYIPECCKHCPNFRPNQLTTCCCTLPYIGMTIC